ncbi:transcription factor WhiB [Streptomyces albireticuli]|uniref:Transcription factor WhiB n=1 Tax=Streptomyces albireticuli TaxID=1940 RepID=A0A2A2D5T6_9ACTN|nr:transcription factor WhiB [Streptomyces albireticuli]MCD9196026.1 transcription factor WhiB [Streptomyces albireticuli]PAU46885.1 transcription factor WhiB [Streptomyces albireticuli]
MNMMTVAPDRVHEQVQSLRAPALQAAVDAGAACADLRNAPLREEWFREESEPEADWSFRARLLGDFCREMCPVMAECRELALRQGEGRSWQDDMVRGGLTGQQLVEERAREAERLAAAVAEDQRATVEWEVYMRAALRQLKEASVVIQAGAALEKARKESNARATEAAAELRAIRRQRRARAGWGEAA